MKPIDFPQKNGDLSKPSDMTDGQCSSLPVYIGVDHEGFPIFISCFKLDSDELLKVIETGKVWLRVYGRVHPPVAVDTKDPWRQE